jgi:uncharacterized DUF497 family protein
MRFEWDPIKERGNIAKHEVDFTTAQEAFSDPRALVLFDEEHSIQGELRWWLLGKVRGRILLVRYTHRPDGVLRLIGAGYWKNGRDYYENYWRQNAP